MFQIKPLHPLLTHGIDSIRFGGKVNFLFVFELFTRMYLHNLPKDVMHMCVLSLLDYLSLVNLEMTSLYFRDLISPMKQRVKDQHILKRYFLLSDKKAMNIIDAIYIQGHGLYLFHDEVFGEKVKPHFINSLLEVAQFLGNSFKGILYWDGWIELENYFKKTFKDTVNCVRDGCESNACEPYFGKCWNHLIEKSDKNEIMLCALQNIYLVDAGGFESHVNKVQEEELSMILKYNHRNVPHNSPTPFEYPLEDCQLISGFTSSNYGGFYLTGVLITAKYTGNNLKRNRHFYNRLSFETPESLATILPDEDSKHDS